jgi:hypothetical protein
MHEKHLYEYAVIRLVPAVEREEFINVGIIVFCKHARYIRVLVKLDTDRLNRFPCCPDVADLSQNLQSFVGIAEGKSTAGPIAQMDHASRFRWLTAVRSSVIQTSRPHPGFSDDLDKTTERLFQELVL